MLPNILTVTEQIAMFRKLSENESTRDEADKLYEEICDNICIISYYLPQTELGLDPEDAADFVLFFRRTIPNVIKNYDVGTGNIFPYLYHCLKMKYRTFLKAKKREADIENAIQIDSAFIMEDEESSVFVSEKECEYGELPYSRQNIRFVRYIFRERPYYRKCFFVYLISLAPDLTDLKLNKLCELFFIDFDEAKILVDIIKPAFVSKDEIRLKDEKRMNINWIKSIRKWDSEQGYSRHTETVIENSEKLKRGYKLPRTAISGLLNQTRTTVFSSIYKIKKLFLFLESKSFGNPAEVPDSFSQSLEKYYGKEIWKKETITLELFRPFTEFSINEDRT